MRKSVLVLSVLLLACAEAPVDDNGPAAESTNKTEPEQSSAKLPPASNPPSDPKDAGTSTSDGTKDAGTAAPQDAGSSPSPSTNDAGTTGTSTSCDPNNSTYAIKAFAELNKSSPRTCGSMGGTCTSTECCFDIYGVCVDK